MKVYSFLMISPWTVVTDGTNKLYDIFPSTVRILLNQEPQIEKKV